MHIQCLNKSENTNMCFFIYILGIFETGVIYSLLSDSDLSLR